MMTISAKPAAGAGAGPVPDDAVSGDVTVTIALTSSPPSGRYSFWATSTVKSGWLIGGLLLGVGGRWPRPLPRPLTAAGEAGRERGGGPGPGIPPARPARRSGPPPPPPPRAA